MDVTLLHRPQSPPTNNFIATPVFPQPSHRPFVFSATVCNIVESLQYQERLHKMFYSKCFWIQMGRCFCAILTFAHINPNNLFSSSLKLINQNLLSKLMIQSHSNAFFHSIKHLNEILCHFHFSKRWLHKFKEICCSQ